MGCQAAANDLNLDNIKLRDKQCGFFLLPYLFSLTCAYEKSGDDVRPPSPSLNLNPGDGRSNMTESTKLCDVFKVNWLWVLLHLPQLAGALICCSSWMRMISSSQHFDQIYHDHLCSSGGSRFTCYCQWQVTSYPQQTTTSLEDHSHLRVHRNLTKCRSALRRAWPIPHQSQTRSTYCRPRHEPPALDSSECGFGTERLGGPLKEGNHACVSLNPKTFAPAWTISRTVATLSAGTRRSLVSLAGQA